MFRCLSALSLSLLLTSAATAGPMSANRQVPARTSAPRYVVSANLNKLVFWHMPERGEADAHR